jgi:hypothetical protein
MRGSVRTVIGALLLASAASAVASTDRAVRSEGNRIFREGTRLINQDRINEGMFRMERVLAYRYRPNVLWNLMACHFTLGQRDLGLWFFERYLALEPEVQRSLRVQQAAAAIAEQDEHMTNREARFELWLTLADAIVDADNRGIALATEDQIVFRAGNTSADAARRARVATDHGTMLFRQGLENVRGGGDWEQALSFFERSLAYRRLRNAAYNIAAIHLGYGRRDLALFFLQQYVDSLPALQGDEGVAAAIRAIEEAPATIRDQATCDRLSGQVEAAVSQALGGSRSAS